jgi:hypothetical protein
MLDRLLNNNFVRTSVPNTDNTKKFDLVSVFAVFSSWVSSLGSVTELTFFSPAVFFELFIFQRGFLFFVRFLRAFFALTF